MPRSTGVTVPSVSWPIAIYPFSARSTWSDEEWGDYVFKRKNPKGWHYERWLHEAGCGRWFNAVRHTVTHEIHCTYEVSDPMPELPE